MYKLELKLSMNIFIPQKGVTEKMNYKKWKPQMESERMTSSFDLIHNTFRKRILYNLMFYEELVRL